MTTWANFDNAFGVDWVDPLNALENVDTYAYNTNFIDGTWTEFLYWEVASVYTTGVQFFFRYDGWDSIGIDCSVEVNGSWMQVVYGATNASGWFIYSNIFAGLLTGMRIRFAKGARPDLWRVCVHWGQYVDVVSHITDSFTADAVISVLRKPETYFILA